jgi:uncharacterized protein
MSTLTDQKRTIDWAAVTESLDRQGFAQTGPCFSDAECDELEELFDAGSFRSTIDMERYRFGQGLYRYFDRPLPALIQTARQELYPPLAELANMWAERLGQVQRHPAALEEFLARCHRAGQTRPTPLILRYGPGGHNTLHQDIYGELAFPFQAVTLLSREGSFSGGEFVLVEQRLRAQSRAHVIGLQRGAFLIFPTRERLVLGKRGYYRTQMRHGVATVRSGQRTTLGVIFHDAK